MPARARPQPNGGKGVHQAFVLHRDVDVTGVSLTGDIAEGVRFTDGTVVLRWRPMPNSSAGASTAVWPNLDSMLAVHGHDGRTRVIWMVD